MKNYLTLSTGNLLKEDYKLLILAIIPLNTSDDEQFSKFLFIYNAL